MQGFKSTWPGTGEEAAEDSLHLENDGLGLRPWISCYISSHSAFQIHSNHFFPQPPAAADEHNQVFLKASL